MRAVICWIIGLAVTALASGSPVSYTHLDPLAAFIRSSRELGVDITVKE